MHYMSFNINSKLRCYWQKHQFHHSVTHLNNIRAEVTSALERFTVSVIRLDAHVMNVDVDKVCGITQRERFSHQRAADNRGDCKKQNKAVFRQVFTAFSVTLCHITNNTQTIVLRMLPLTAHKYSMMFFFIKPCFITQGPGSIKWLCSCIIRLRADVLSSAGHSFIKRKNTHLHFLLSPRGGTLDSPARQLLGYDVTSIHSHSSPTLMTHSRCRSSHDAPLDGINGGQDIALPLQTQRDMESCASR